MRKHAKRVGESMRTQAVPVLLSEQVPVSVMRANSTQRGSGRQNLRQFSVRPFFHAVHESDSMSNSSDDKNGPETNYSDSLSSLRVGATGR